MNLLLTILKFISKKKEDNVNMSSRNQKNSFSANNKLMKIKTLFNTFLLFSCGGLFLLSSLYVFILTSVNITATILKIIITQVIAAIILIMYGIMGIKLYRSIPHLVIGEDIMTIPLVKSFPLCWSPNSIIIDDIKQIYINPEKKNNNYVK